MCIYIHVHIQTALTIANDFLCRLPEGCKNLKFWCWSINIVFGLIFITFANTISLAKQNCLTVCLTVIVMPKISLF